MLFFVARNAVAHACGAHIKGIGLIEIAFVAIAAIKLLASSAAVVVVACKAIGRLAKRGVVHVRGVAESNGNAVLPVEVKIRRNQSACAKE